MQSAGCRSCDQVFPECNGAERVAQWSFAVATSIVDAGVVVAVPQRPWTFSARRSIHRGSIGRNKGGRPTPTVSRDGSGMLWLYYIKAYACCMECAWRTCLTIAWSPTCRERSHWRVSLWKTRQHAGAAACLAQCRAASHSVGPFRLLSMVRA